ncbi:MAG: two-component sensor histidine kinase [Chitinophagaceae bacterium]|nr:MAG: two-component sensor histidine kinase [Chitinophagaceae bacterium]
MRKLLDRISFRLVNYMYWFLLCYLLAALAWWYFELVQQNNLMYALQKQQLMLFPGGDAGMLEIITDEHARNAKQYIGEGLTFLVITILGAVFVYGAVRRQVRFHLQQKNFMMAVTHELKTPIAVTKLSLETLRRHKLDETKQKEILNNAINETDRLNALCNNILLSSQLESGGYTLIPHEFDFSDMALKAVKEFQNRYPARLFEFNMPESIYFNGEEFLLQLVLNNLIENAVKYTPSTNSIKINVVDFGSSLELSVADLGSGIPETEKEKIFEKFYRLGDEMKRSSKGTGLGLFLSTKIIKDHKGRIYVEDNIPHGSIFKIILPK